MNIDTLSSKFYPKKIKRIQKGRNNFVYSFREKNKIKIIKIFRDNERFIKELNFLKYLRKININNVPKIEIYDQKNKFYVSDYIKGHKLKKITKKEILLCLNFIKKINSRKPKFDNATDACLSLYDHCRIVEEKINLVKKIKIKDKKIVNILLISSSEFQRIKKNLNNGEFNFYKKLKKSETILSPSDFGFHNIKFNKNKLLFFDFEYSGMDDPIKLVCDFFCQPDYIIDITYFDYFLKNLITKKDYLKKKTAFKLLLKLHSIKWICILIKHLYNNPNKLNIDFSKKKSKIYKYFKRINSWK